MNISNYIYLYLSLHPSINFILKKITVSVRYENYCLDFFVLIRIIKLGWNFQIVYILVSTSNDINRWKLIEIKWVFIKPNTFALLPLNSIFMGWGYTLSNKNIFSPVNTWSPSVMSSLNDCRKELINSRLAFKCTPFRDVWDHRLCLFICSQHKHAPA